MAKASNHQGAFRLGNQGRISIQGTFYGLAAAVCWAISPIFIRKGLEGLPSPLLGVTLSLVVNVIAYGLVLLLRRGEAQRDVPLNTGLLFLQLLAGVLVGLSMAARWIALDLVEVAIVLAIGRLNVPVVILLSPLVVGRHLERWTRNVVLGGALIVVGSMLLVVSP